MRLGLGDAIDEVADLDPATLSDDELHDVVTELVREDSRFAAARARLVAAWDARKQWADNGSRAAAARLMYETGVSAKTAKRELRRARSLRTMPHTATALAEGKLSMDKADLLINVNQPALSHLFARDEGMLVDEIQRLRHPAAQRCTRYWLQLAHDEAGREPYERDRQGRHFSCGRTLQNSFVLKGLLPPIAGAIVAGELRRLEQQLFAADWAEARSTHGPDATGVQLPRTAAQRWADALVMMAERSAAMDPHAVLPRPLFTVLCGYDPFAKTCELADGTVVAPAELVDYLANADVERIVFDGPSRVIDVGVRTRFFKGALRRAIQVRDRHCQHPSGCDVPAEECDVDHVDPYSRGGLTVQGNGRCYCNPHNRQRNNQPDRPDPPEP
jgi:hypothetical protein